MENLTAYYKTISLAAHARAALAQHLPPRQSSEKPGRHTPCTSGCVSVK